MSDLDAVAADTDTGGPVLETTMHGRTWTFGRPDIRPSALRRYAEFANKFADTNESDIDTADAIALSALAEEMLRSGLPDAKTREAFDTAAFTGTDITALCDKYFNALGADVGESAASPAPSPSTVARSRPTSKPRTTSD